MDEIGKYLETMRAAPPLVHNITNYVAMNVMANVVLAIGASPAMVHAREEAAEFAGVASVLTVNIGTLDPDWLAAMEEAAQAAIDYNNENRIAEEAELVAFFEEQGLTVYEPDVAAFRDTVQAAYLESEFSQDWPDGLLERVNATGTE